MPLTPTEALLLLLSHIDYTQARCGMMEPISKLVPDELMMRCREAARPTTKADQSKPAP